jgi:AbrB family looped-hinge helix DNA binding protein
MLKSSMSHGQFIAVQRRGLLALPKEVRSRLGLDRPGAQVEVVEREDGVIELHPHVAVPADQAWFWAERWQRMERQVDDHVEQGEVTTFDSSADFLSSLEKVESDR